MDQAGSCRLDVKLGVPGELDSNLITVSITNCKERAAAGDGVISHLPTGFELSCATTSSLGS